VQEVCTGCDRPGYYKPQKPSWRRGAERAYCTDNFLSVRALEGIADLRRQFQQLLAEAGFLGGRRGRAGGRGGGGGGEAGWGNADAHAGARRASPRFTASSRFATGSCRMAAEELQPWAARMLWSKAARGPCSRPLRVLAHGFARHKRARSAWIHTA